MKPQSHSDSHLTILKSSPRFMTSGLLLFILFIQSTLSCPTDETLLQRCRCQSSFNGILMDCSGADFVETLTLLKANRNQLGLMQELTFANSTITRLSNNIFNGLFIKKLVLSSNGITTVERSAFAGLQNVLQIIALRDNRLSAIPTDALNGLGSLLQIDLSQNEIGDLPAEVFRTVPKLYDVNLANNQICFINEDAFANIKLALQTLNLGGNCLDKVPASAIRGFPQLLALHLHENRITGLDALQVMNLRLLNLINLSGNLITSIHQQSFLNVPNLKFMYLKDNQIRSLSNEIFRPFEKLELLDLSENQMQSLPTGVFAKMPRLAQLYLAGNQIGEIQPGAFENSSIVILLLSDNDLVRVSQDMFTGLSYLQQLSLKNNKIKFVAQNAFYQMPSLVVLDLSHNRITSLPASAFLAQLNMYLLDLGHNDMTSVPYNSLNQRIVTVVLQENPLVCTERVHVIQQGVGLFVPNSPDEVCGPGSGGGSVGQGGISAPDGISPENIGPGPSIIGPGSGFPNSAGVGNFDGSINNGQGQRTGIGGGLANGNFGGPNVNGGGNSRITQLGGANIDSFGFSQVSAIPGNTNLNPNIGGFGPPDTPNNPFRQGGDGQNRGSFGNPINQGSQFPGPSSQPAGFGSNGSGFGTQIRPSNPNSGELPIVPVLPGQQGTGRIPSQSFVVDPTPTTPKISGGEGTRGQAFIGGPQTIGDEAFSAAIATDQPPSRLIIPFPTNQALPGENTRVQGGSSASNGGQVIQPIYPQHPNLKTGDKFEIESNSNDQQTLPPNQRNQNNFGLNLTPLDTVNIGNPNSRFQPNSGASRGGNGNFAPPSPNDPPPGFIRIPFPSNNNGGNNLGGQSAGNFGGGPAPINIGGIDREGGIQIIPQVPPNLIVPQGGPVIQPQATSRPPNPFIQASPSTTPQSSSATYNVVVTAENVTQIIYNPFRTTQYEFPETTDVVRPDTEETPANQNRNGVGNDGREFNSNKGEEFNPTLPPGIIIAGEGSAFEEDLPWNVGHTLGGSEVRTLPPKKPPQESPWGVDLGLNGGEDNNASSHPPPNNNPASKKTSPAITASTIIAVALTIVVVVLLVVFVTLCVVRHRARHRGSSGGGKSSSSSSASRTSAYVAAQAARVNFNITDTNSGHPQHYTGCGGGGLQYGSSGGTYMRPSPPRPPSTNGDTSMSPNGGGNAAWLYAPGTYAATSSYYNK